MDLPAFAQCLGSLACVVTQLTSALITGLVLFLVASGLSLIFGVMGVLNFAHGSLYMLGAYLSFSLLGFGNFGLVAVVAAAGVAVIGLILERVFIRHIYRAPLLYQLLLTYAFILVFDDLAKIIWGYDFVSVGVPEMFRRPPLFIGRAPVPVFYVFIIATGITVAAGLWVLLTRTRFGKIVRAAADNPTMVAALGINVAAVSTAVFALGSFLAGLGGVLAAPVRSIYPGMGFSILVESFIVVVIGGLGSMAGAFVGALLIGFVRAFGSIAFPALEEGLVFMLMAVVLLLRPRGVLGAGKEL
ncbi:MAG: branched-chain amino acid ABC transporter permease [Candidatus Rokubacteria bacterium]|nr:branched-chain amino acid ABC transporter permease [Candidatus Rokubacteria bacterium]